jgi:hypothetical protein
MPTKEEIEELDALISAVEKNSHFRQLAIYSVNILTKAALSHENVDTRASIVVLTALQKHKGTHDMLTSSVQCLMALAEDPRQATAVVDAGGFELLIDHIKALDDGSHNELQLKVRSSTFLRFDTSGPSHVKESNRSVDLLSF